ncbi:MAG: hypothetical protein JO301_10435 [Chitinophagaceae bacterium]|nr:hypothetical protein [Chitinophagaceae bacterium]
MTKQQSKTRTGRLVDRKHVDTLIRNYKLNRWVHNTKRLGKPDALSAWFSLETLKEFLELAEQQQADGLKVYYGVYPADYSEKPEYRGRQTVVFVATKEKTNAAGATVNKDIYYLNGSEAQILAFNEASLCPPNCSPDGNGIDTDGIGITIFENEGTMHVI